MQMKIQKRCIFSQFWIAIFIFNVFLQMNTYNYFNIQYAFEKYQTFYRNSLAHSKIWPIFSESFCIIMSTKFFFTKFILCKNGNGPSIGIQLKAFIQICIAWSTSTFVWITNTNWIDNLNGPNIFVTTSANES